MSDEYLKDKHGEEIQQGDVVGTRYRGGTREGAGSSMCMSMDLDTLHASIQLHSGIEVM